MTLPLDPSLADTIGFELLEGELGRDVEATIRTALKAGVVFAVGKTPIAIFHDAVRTAIGRIHENDRAQLLLRFFEDGPYEDGGEFPKEFHGKHLTDDETAAVTSFIHSSMVNAFKGALAELLAIDPCLRLMRKLQQQGILPGATRLFAGDTVWSMSGREGVFAKGADMHWLDVPDGNQAAKKVGLAGVIEVKSYLKTTERLRPQLAQHVLRARRGLRIGGVSYLPQRVAFLGNNGYPVRVAVTPADWPLPRGFRFQTESGRKLLLVDPPQPPSAEDRTVRLDETTWHVTLRWSKEALDAAGYGLTFWLMEKVGEALYANGVPKEWSEMTPAQAGQNAAKMSLYYAILRARNRRDDQRAVAIYNSYGFGYALGMNFRNKEGRREMLWPQDLDEILADGKTKSGCRIV